MIWRTGTITGKSSHDGMQKISSVRVKSFASGDRRHSSSLLAHHTSLLIPTRATDQVSLSTRRSPDCHRRATDFVSW